MRPSFIRLVVPILLPPLLAVLPLADMPLSQYLKSGR